MCGIAYELIYFRLLSLYIGDIFYVSASILAVFFISMAAGHWLSSYGAKKLALVEMAIGVYSIILVLTLSDIMPSIHASLSSLDAHQIPVATIALIWVVLVIPAMLIGFSVPLFSLILSQTSQQAVGVSFRAVYMSYNIAAAFCVALIEYVLLATFGITAVTLVLGGINIVIGLCLIQLRININPVPLAHQPRVLSVSRKKMLSLVLSGIASGVFYLSILKVFHAVFGPFNENFPIVLIIALLGLAIGTWLQRKLQIGYAAWLVMTALSLGMVWVLLSEWIMLASQLLLFHVDTGYQAWLMKLVMMTVLAILPFIGFGGVVPAFVSDQNHDSRILNKILMMASLSNCGGFLLMMFVLHPFLEAGWSAALSIILVVAASWLGLPHKPSLRIVVPSLAALMLSAYFIKTWPERELMFSYQEIFSMPYAVSGHIPFQKENVKVYKQANSQLNIIQNEKGTRQFTFDGYGSLMFDKKGTTALIELIPALTSALYTPEHHEALVLGLGTGVTVSGAAHAYNHVDVFEANPIMLHALHHFKRENFSVQNNPRVSIMIQDAWVGLQQTSKRYDAIINTVTSPIYFSSAKLYTKELFEMASRRLKPEGVYSFWMDVGTPMAAAKMIFAAAKETFRDCHYGLLNAGYIQVICSPTRILKPIALPQSFWPKELVSRYQEYDFSVKKISNFLLMFVFTKNPMLADDEDVLAGWESASVEKPKLEHEIVRGIYRSNDLEMWDSSKTPLSIMRVTARGKNLTEEKAVDRCKAISEFIKGQSCLLIELFAHCGILSDATIQAWIKNALLNKETMGAVLDGIKHLKDTGRAKMIPPLLDPIETPINSNYFFSLDNLANIDSVHYTPGSAFEYYENHKSGYPCASH